MNKHARTAKIEAAAYQVLAEKGFKGASMLAVARAARASNETLYKWYGDKTGLFAALIASNAAQVEAELTRMRADQGDPVDVLAAVAQALLRMVTSDRAVALNRAAAGDMTGQLGAALARHGRGRVAPILADLLKQIYGPADDLPTRLDRFLSLLIGDLQIRRATHAMPEPTQAEITHRCDAAMADFLRLYPLPHSL